MDVAALFSDRCLSIPITLHAAMSYPTLLGMSVAAAVTEHKQQLKAFESELTWSSMKSVVGGPHRQESSIGVKRPRVDT